MAIRTFLGTIIDCFGSAIRFLANKIVQTRRYDGSEEQRQVAIQDLEDTVANKKKTYEQLLKRKLDLEEDLAPGRRHQFIELVEQRNQLVDQYEVNLEDTDVYNLIIEELIKVVERDLRAILTVPEAVSELASMREILNEREQYRRYGLLLSGAGIKVDGFGCGSPRDVKRKVREKNHFIQESVIKEDVQKALTLTRSMLTLLPPLLVTQPHCYHEEVQEPNRVTWDEGKREPLIYYRPVLVYGNHLHVAYKGLVGNSEVGHVDYQYEKEDSYL